VGAALRAAARSNGALLAPLATAFGLDLTARLAAPPAFAGRAS